jgi:hypothetical protein
VRALRWSAPALLVTEAALVATGVLSLARAAAVFLAVEGLLALCALAQLGLGVRQYRRRRSDGADREAALTEALQAVLPAPVAALVRHELAIATSLALYLRRRRSGVEAGVVPIGYDRALRPLSVTFLALSMVELAVVEVAVPWPTVRLVLLVAGGYTVLFVAGLAAANVVRPHLVTAADLRLRSGTWADVPVPLDRIATVTARRRAAPDRTVSVVDDALVLGIGGGTTVDVELREPTVLPVGRRTHPVRAVRFAADDPHAAVAAVRASLAATRLPPL